MDSFPSGRIPNVGRMEPGGPNLVETSRPKLHPPAKNWRDPLSSGDEIMIKSCICERDRPTSPSGSVCIPRTESMMSISPYDRGTDRSYRGHQRKGQSCSRRGKRSQHDDHRAYIPPFAAHVGGRRSAGTRGSSSYDEPGSECRPRTFGSGVP